MYSNISMPEAIMDLLHMHCLEEPVSGVMQASKLASAPAVS
jgi:hypothetical protein